MKPHRSSKTHMLQVVLDDDSKQKCLTFASPRLCSCVRQKGRYTTIMSISTPSYTDRAKAGMIVTVDKLRAFDTDKRTNACRKALARALSYAAETRATVDAYTAPLFAKYEFFNDLEASAGRAERTRITDQKMLYLSQDEVGCRKFYDECFAAAKLAGYDVVDDQCPALMAEHAVVRLENALLDLAANVFGINLVDSHGDLRKRAIKLLSETCRR